MTPLARMIDANINRASEGLRVLEDVARFVIGCQTLCAGCKSVRHALRRYGESLGSSAPALDGLGRLAARDTPGDAGVGVSGAGEYQRPTVASVAVAAGARACEALRVLEESAKAAGAIDAARLAEKARYETYDLHRRVVIALGTGRRTQWKLCVLITEELCSKHSWRYVAKMAIDGGADCLQLREKAMPDRALLVRTRELIEMARPSGVAVVVNDRPDVALLAGADGVHVGQDDLPAGEIRRLAGSSLLVGVSVSNVEQAAAAVLDGADLCGIGPVFPTSTKQRPFIAGLGVLSAYRSDPRLAGFPCLAIGGIGPENIAQVVGRGFGGVAVSSCVCSAADPAEVCRRLRRELDGERSSPPTQDPRHPPA
ncbi:MAG: thiamine phosphate synthase [Phycisphaeraceae bacterium]|nr:thiamine phosphate synthase [Phycisphaeraceae bacterium]